MKEVSHFINGVTRHGGTQWLPVVDPATAQKIGAVCLADELTINECVASSREAFASWRRTTPGARASILQAFLRLLEANADELVELLSREHGKTLADARGELLRGIENVEFATGIAEHLKGEHSRGVGPGIDSWSELAPVGICVGVTPFNFPAMVPLWMFPLAIACGNAFILKPSERVPSVANRLAELFSEAGLPAGVLNVLQGGQQTSQALLEHADVSAVSFVGSTAVARSIYRTAGNTGKRVQALGGAKNHAVVLPDADIETTANAIMGAAYGSCGQRCMALSVIVTVGEALASRLTDRLQEKVRGLEIGPGDQDLDMGPVNSAVERDRILSLIDQGVREGATLLVDGRDHACRSRAGFFIGGTLFDRVLPEMTIYQEEIFGPVLCIVRVDSAVEALALVNNNQYGNGSCVFTRDGFAAREFASEVESGMVGINVPLPVPVANHSFGGWKDSRFGDLAAYGPDGVRFYTRRKTISQRWQSGEESAVMDFSFPGGSRR